MALPRVPGRPFQPGRARRILAELLEDPQRTEKVFELLEALGGRGDDRTFRRFAMGPGGPKLLREKPSLVAELADRDSLARLPEGSLGRAYLEFATTNGVTAEGLLEANQQVFSDRDRQHPDHVWFFDRLNAMHDLWHVLSGYRTDEAGESALLAFSCAAGIASRGMRFLAWFTLLRAPKSDLCFVQRYLIAAWRRGRAAANLLSVAYEQELAAPLEEVRARLGIVPFERTHPAGVLRFERDGSYQLAPQA